MRTWRRWRLSIGANWRPPTPTLRGFRGCAGLIRWRDEAAIQALVGDGRDVPRKVFRHAAAHALHPLIPVLPGCSRLLDRTQQGLGSIFGEFETGGFVHRVIEAAGGAHDRYRAVAQAVHLVQATRLVLAGHQEHVGGSLN